MEGLINEAQRRRAIAWAAALTLNTPLAPQHHEQVLLERYARGEITLEQVQQQLQVRVQHVLYRSQAIYPFTPEQLTDLVDEARRYNEAHGITGLLCYSAGNFVQLLEGDAVEVEKLYAKIRQDSRHQQVVLLHEATESERFFADWRMAFVTVGSEEFYWLLTHLEARQHRLIVPQMPIMEPHLLTLLQAFSEAA